MNISSRCKKNSLNGKQLDPLPFLMDHLPEDSCKTLEIELNETPEKKFESIINLREMIKGEETLESIDFHNDFLQQFLRGSKYDVKKALNALKNFVYNVRNNPFFAPLTDEAFEKIKQAKILKFLPKRTPDGCTLHIVRYDTWNPREISLSDVNRYATMIMQQSLRDQMTQINGMVAIHDMKNLPYRNIRHFTPSFLYDFVHAYCRCFPVRYKSVHLVNHPATFKYTWAIVRRLLPEKIRNRVVFHSHAKDLLEYMPATVIPEEYGGLLREELYETTMSNWLTEAFKHHKQRPLGGQSNYY